MLLVRHGESLWNERFGATRVDPGTVDPGLTGRGREQATAAAGLLAEMDVVRLVASPYRRTLQTADLIARRLGLSITIEPLARERCAFSCDIGSEPEVLAKAWPDISFENLALMWWGGRIESHASLEHRGRLFYERARRWSDRERVAVVTHWGFIRTLTGQAVGNAEIVRVTFDAAPATP